MKTNRASLFAGLTFLLAMGSAQAQIELTTNGGFETGDFTGWQQFPQLGTISISTINPNSGTFSANLNSDGAASGDVIKNANIGIGQVSPGQQVDISFFARGSVANGGVAFAEFFSELDGGGTSAAEILGGGPLALDPNPDNWTLFQFTTFAGPDVSGGVTLQLKSACGAAPGCIADIFFDDASVQIVPVPAAVWLFGSALGLLGWIRRKAS